MKYIDEVGSKYGSLTVLRKEEGGCRWLCRCDCGKKAVAIGSALRRKHKTSCGCGVSKNRANTIHGLSGTSEYTAWRGMIARCYNPQNNRYPDYGGRGIAVSEKWLDKQFGMLRFLDHVGKRPSKNHSIDRIDSNGNYEAGNIRWATKKEQANNRRKYCVLSKFTTGELLTELKRRSSIAS